MRKLLNQTQRWGGDARCGGGGAVPDVREGSLLDTKMDYLGGATVGEYIIQVRVGVLRRWFETDAVTDADGLRHGPLR